MTKKIEEEGVTSVASGITASDTIEVRKDPELNIKSKKGRNIIIDSIITWISGNSK